MVVSGLDDEAATRIMAAAMAMSVEVSGAAHLPESVRSRFIDGGLPDGPATILRLEGLSASVEARTAKLLSVMDRVGPWALLEGEESRLLWRQVRDVSPYAGQVAKPLWKVSVAPSVGHQLVAALRMEAGIDAFTTGRAASSGCRWRRTPRRICCAARSGRSAAAMQLW